MKYFLAMFLTISVIFNVVTMSDLYRLEKYYEATENLLDTLESEYNWVDAIDNYDYYEAVENLGK